MSDGDFLRSLHSGEMPAGFDAIGNRIQSRSTPPKRPVTDIPPGESFEGSVGAKIHELSHLLAKLWAVTDRTHSWILTEDERALLDQNLEANELLGSCDAGFRPHVKNDRCSNWRLE